MKKLLVLLSFCFVFQAFAQNFTPSASEVTIEEAQKLFEELQKENDKMKEHSECFERAHMWARRSEIVNNITTEKVFLFFTRKFEMKLDLKTRWNRPLKWWFHVAPAVRVNGELIVLDATFSDKAVPLQDWASSLMKDPEQCVELTDYSDYANDRNLSSNIQCYYSATPQYVYGPLALGIKEVKGPIMQYVPAKNIPSQWLPQSLKWALKSYKWKYRKEAKKELKL